MYGRPEKGRPALYLGPKMKFRFSIDGAAPDLKVVIVLGLDAVYLLQDSATGEFVVNDLSTEMIEGMTREVYADFLAKGEITIWSDEDGTTPYTLEETEYCSSSFVLRATPVN